MNLCENRLLFRGPCFKTEHKIRRPRFSWFLCIFLWIFLAPAAAKPNLCELPDEQQQRCVSGGETTWQQQCGVEQNIAASQEHNSSTCGRDNDKWHRPKVGSLWFWDLGKFSGLRLCCCDRGWTSRIAVSHSGVVECVHITTVQIFCALQNRTVGRDLHTRTVGWLVIWSPREWVRIQPKVRSELLAKIGRSPRHNFCKRSIFRLNAGTSKQSWSTRCQSSSWTSGVKTEGWHFFCTEFRFCKFLLPPRKSLAFLENNIFVIINVVVTIITVKTVALKTFMFIFNDWSST